jgi:DNA-binding NarL/FixJ family response regulator
MTIRVVVVDDQALIRIGLCGIIGTAPDLEVVGTAATGGEALDVARRERPDVLLMDVRMPGMNGIEATARIAADVRVLMLTTFDLDDYVYGALRAGASGFLLKDTPPADLLAAIRVVAGGAALLAPGVTRRLIAEFVARPDPLPAAKGPAGVTDREREVLRLVAEGLSNNEIGARLHITPGTAKTHVGHLLTKLGARDRVHLVIFAFRTGLAGRDQSIAPGRPSFSRPGGSPV